MSEAFVQFIYNRCVSQSEYWFTKNTQILFKKKKKQECTSFISLNLSPLQPSLPSYISVDRRGTFTQNPLLHSGFSLLLKLSALLPSACGHVVRYSVLSPSLFASVLWVVALSLLPLSLSPHLLQLLAVLPLDEALLMSHLREVIWNKAHGNVWS